MCIIFIVLNRIIIYDKGVIQGGNNTYIHTT